MSAARGGLSDLGPRLASGLALGAAAAAAIWAGGWISALLVSAAAGAMAWEYRAIVASRDGGFTRRDVFFPALVALAPFIAHLEGRVAPAGFLLLGGVIVTVSLDRGGGRDWRWTAPGVLLLGGASSAFVFLRDQPAYGLETSVWLVLVVAATDIGGYFAGRLIGGPRLAPSLSPSKTWAGFIGGAALAAFSGGMFSWATTGTYYQEVVAVSLVAAAVAQMGDLAESALKRRFGVKDASKLIPGHGGALDRLDGLLAATIVAAIVTFARGKEVFVW
ncbi:MAG: phosphatidate cytidylyltransferase [Neomegalonema sp.]|nr:phosphatidate cytidylyltransferase [Neomegalonema sp.]